MLWSSCDLVQTLVYFLYLTSNILKIVELETEPCSVFICQLNTNRRRRYTTCVLTHMSFIYLLDANTNVTVPLRHVTSPRTRNRLLDSLSLLRDALMFSKVLMTSGCFSSRPWRKIARLHSRCLTTPTVLPRSYNSTPKFLKRLATSCMILRVTSP